MMLNPTVTMAPWPDPLLVLADHSFSLLLVILSTSMNLHVPHIPGRLMVAF